jgi:hypothetical protein
VETSQLGKQNADGNGKRQKDNRCFQPVTLPRESTIEENQDREPEQRE